MSTQNYVRGLDAPEDRMGCRDVVLTWIRQIEMETRGTEMKEAR